MKTSQKLQAALALALTLATALAGCGASAEPSPKYDHEKLPLNTISRAELTNRERLLLGDSQSASFVFDFNAGEGYGELGIWMERYDFGVLAEDRTLNMSGTLRSGEDGTNPVRGSIVFSMSPVVGEDGESEMSTVRVAVANGHGYSAITIPPIESPKNMARSNGSGLRRETPIDGIIELAQINYSSVDEMTVIYNDTADEGSGLFTDYDVTYVLKCEFVKKA